jgi:hypothetical protein
VLAEGRSSRSSAHRSVSRQRTLRRLGGGALAHLRPLLRQPHQRSPRQAKVATALAQQTVAL